MNDRLLRAKSVDLYHYLAENGNHPVRENSRVAYYISPKRDEGNPSFEVSKVKNTWADWGESNAYGDSIDYVKWMQECTTPEAIDILIGGEKVREYHKEDNFEPEVKQIDVLEVHDEITNETMVEYLEVQRRIPLEVANEYMKEVIFQFGSTQWKKYYGLGLPNDKGGWAIRGTWFKGNTKPSGICTAIDVKGSITVNLFEGTFDFLSYIILTEPPYDTSIILNSLIYIPFIVDNLRGYDNINLYLDNDAPADEKIEYMFAQGLNPTDKRDWYSEFNDLNDFLISNYDI